MSRKAKVSLETVNDNLKEILRKVEHFQSATESNFASIGGTVSRMSLLVARIPEIESRLSSMETEVRSIRTRLDGLGGLYQHLDKKVEILDHEYVSISAALKRLEERFDRLEADQLRDRLRTLEERVTVLEKSIVN